MARAATRSLGRQAEEIALEFLLGEGLELITRNFSCRVGEIDLVMSHGACLVFTEVRYRKWSRFASASESVDRRKQQKLIRAAAFFVARRPQFRYRTMRFDVVALDGPSQQEFKLQWLRDAFRPESR